MLKNSLFACCFLFQIILHGQNLIPCLGADGKYGYATESGKVVIEPAFEELPPMPDGQVAVECKQKGLPLLLLRHGMTLSSKYRPAGKPVENFGLEKNTDRLDSIGHLAFFYDQGKILFVNLEKQTSAEYLNNNRVQTPERQNIRFGNFNKVFNCQLYTYFHADGRELTAFNIVEGPGYLASHNLVTVLDESGAERQLILDGNGEVAHVLADMVSGTNSYSKHEVKPVDYLVVKARNDLPADPQGQNLTIEEILQLQATISPAMGLMDSTGQIVLPLCFKNLKIIAPGRLLSAENEAGQTQLLDWQGGVAYTFPKEKDLTQRLLPDRRILVADGQRTLPVSADGRVLQEFPVVMQPILRKEVEAENFFRAKDVNGKDVWVGLADGKVFRE